VQDSWVDFNIEDLHTACQNISLRCCCCMQGTSACSNATTCAATVCSTLNQTVRILLNCFKSFQAGLNSSKLLRVLLFLVLLLCQGASAAPALPPYSRLGSAQTRNGRCVRQAGILNSISY
jgi:hypothetical protein